MLTHIGKNFDVGCKIINFVIIFFLLFFRLASERTWGWKHHFVFACLYSCLRKALKYQWSWQYSTSLWKAKSRKYQGVFEVKSRVKTWQVRGIWSQQLEHKQVPQLGTDPGVRKGKRSCWHATPVANAPWKPLILGEGQAQYKQHNKTSIIHVQPRQVLKLTWKVIYRWKRQPYFF